MYVERLQLYVMVECGKYLIDTEMIYMRPTDERRN